MIWLKIAPYVLAVALFTGGVWYIYNKGKNDERSRTAIEEINRTKEDRILRESTESTTRSLDDERALACLRNPSNCKR